MLVKVFSIEAFASSPYGGENGHHILTLQKGHRENLLLLSHRRKHSWSVTPITAPRLVPVTDGSQFQHVNFEGHIH